MLERRLKRLGSLEPVLPMPLGRRRFDDYEILGEIGHGGMRIVYRTRRRSTDEHVALEVLVRSAFADERTLERFRREVEVLERMDHPSIV